MQTTLFLVSWYPPEYAVGTEAGVYAAGDRGCLTCVHLCRHGSPMCEVPLSPTALHCCVRPGAREPDLCRQSQDLLTAWRLLTFVVRGNLPTQ